MKIVAKNFSLTEPLKEYALKKLGYFQQRFGISNITVTLSQEKKNSTAQFLGTFSKTNALVKVKASDNTMYAVIDKVYSICKVKLSRTKNQTLQNTHALRKKRKGIRAFEEPAETMRSVPVTLMSRELALEKMLRSKYHFWLYTDKDTGLFTVLYKSGDGQICVIHPVFE
ncbi:MAG: HPF/RaiA family ribosome-associated protein [bacterium]